jgi:hypothetical protein
VKPTKSFLEPAPGWRLAPLATSSTVKDVANACRSAALGFAWGANRGWGKSELARWLTEPYARALATTRHLRAPVRLRVVPSVPPPPLAESAVEKLLVETHARLIEVLRRSWSWLDDPSFARDVLEAGHVIGVADDRGGIGYAPFETAEMRLIDRVRSLFIADFLSRPHDYARFGICDACDAVTFDWAGLHENCSSAFKAPTPTPSRSVFRRARTLVGL